MITTLTKEQKKLVPVYLNKWLSKGRRTQTIDQVQAKECASFLYKDILGKQLPKYYIFLDSPMQVNLALNLLKMNKKQSIQLYSQLGSQLDIQLYSQLGSQLDSQLGSQLYNQLGSQLYNQLGSQLRSQLRSQLGSQLDSQLDSQLRSQFSIQLDSQLGSQLDSQIRSQLDSQLSSQLDSQLGSQIRSQLDSQKLEYFYESRGSLWQAYYYHYDFILNELFKEKANQPEFIKFNQYVNHISNIHMIYMFDDICFFSDFPKEINVNSIGQLHNPNGAALLYRDGYSLLRSNGISVTQEFIDKKPEDFKAEDITKETNADTRREIIRKIGNKRLLEILDYKVIDTFEEYKLISFDIGDGRVRPFIMMNCPSTNILHILGVRPEITKAVDALAFLFNQTEYRRPILEDGINRGGEIECFKEGQVVFRHGDVNFKKYTGEINAVENMQTKGIIHKGNNNNHEYAEGLFEVQMVNGKKIVVVLDKSTIDHNEHGKQIHPVGTYEVDIAQEFDHWLEESRKVID